LIDTLKLTYPLSEKFKIDTDPVEYTAKSNIGQVM
jgi:hypothetical protein